MTEMERKPSVAEWIAGKDILITGATGFMGKVLVEKLLRSCPDLNRLHLVIRTKRGCDPDERIKEFTGNPLFSVLLEQNPHAFDKVTVIPGDMTQPCCGISEKHLQMLKDNISIVFHVSASVRFDDSLSEAVKMNTRGTFELTKIAKEMKKLEVFEYVSTTYSNANLDETIEEKVYPSHMDWKALVKLLDTDADVLDILMRKLIGTQPNTYTFSKSLAENVVLEASKEIPALIFRPSVVVSTYQEPIPGWTENLNGIIGVNAACSKGVLRTFKCCPHTTMDYVPVDISINGLITAAWSKRFSHEPNAELQIYNQAYADRIAVTFMDIINAQQIANEKYPSDNNIWYPFAIITNNTFYYHFLFFTLQLIPAIFLDLLLSLYGRKPILVRLNTKIYNAAMALSPFSTKFFKFASKRYSSIHEQLSREDQVTFCIHEDVVKFDVLEFIMDSQLGSKRYLFNEKDEDLPKYRKMHKRLYYIDRATRVLIIGFVIWKIFGMISSYL